MLIVDTGVLVAATDRADRFHKRCVELLEAATGPLVTRAMVIAECSYLIERELGSDAESLLYQSIIDQTLPLGGLDASLIAIAERLGQSTIATLDQRHFNDVRPIH